MIIITLFVIGWNIYFYKLSQIPITYEQAYNYCISAYYDRLYKCMTGKGFNFLE